MPKKVEPSEKKVLVSIKMGLLHDLLQISEDINTSIEYLFNEKQRKEEALIERDKTIENLANAIYGIDEAMKEDNDKEVSDNLAKAKEILQQHLDYLNRNVKVKQ